MDADEVETGQSREYLVKAHADNLYRVYWNNPADFGEILLEEADEIMTILLNIKNRYERGDMTVTSDEINLIETIDSKIWVHARDYAEANT